MTVQQKEDEAPKAEPMEEKKVVSYNSEQTDSQREELEDITDLEDKGFKEAMKQLRGK